MDRLPILLINRDPAFPGTRGPFLERRGCDVFPAESVEDVRVLMTKHRFVLCLVNAVSTPINTPSLRALHLALRRDLPMPSIIVAGQEEVLQLQAMNLPDLHLIVAPVAGDKLLERTAELIGVGRRRVAHSLLQLREDNVAGVRMGFIENVSRHGFLARFDLPVSEQFRGTAHFMLPGAPEQSEARVRFARTIPGGPPYRQAFAFTEGNAKLYDTIAAYVGT